jgi:hypothetical protein
VAALCKFQRRRNELRDFRNGYISNACKEVSTFGTLLNFNLLTKEHFGKFDRVLKDIQLYETLEEINTARRLIINLIQIVS